MKGKFFIDTNILIYTLDSRDDRKRNIARELLLKSRNNGLGIVSFQVVQEFINASKKFIEESTHLATLLDRVIIPMWEINPSWQLYRNMLEVHKVFGYSVYDSLIIAAALQANCEILYSEDLQDDHQINDLLIRNPFRI